MRRRDRRKRFHFENQPIVDDQIGDVATDDRSAVIDIERFLLLESDILFAKFYRQRAFLDIL
ncbi:hypothetical protein SAHY_11753 [Salinisphaera hydrothermalis EPR70]